MYSVSGNNIVLTRGDSFYARVQIVKDGQDYVPQEGDYVRFYLKRGIMNAAKTRYIDENPLLTKAILNDSMLLHIRPEDTKKLPFGHYVYDVEIEFANGDIDTFINKASFDITEEVG